MRLTTVFFLMLLFMEFSCTTEHSAKIKDAPSLQKDTLQNKYANCFQIIQSEERVEINIINPDNLEVIENYQFTKTPQRIIAGSATHIGMMKALSLEKLLVGIPEYQYLCAPLNTKTTKAVGDIFRANAEDYLAVQPDLILYSGFDRNAPIFEKFRQAQMSTFLMYEWKENHPLGRAEWLKVYGILFNKEQEAQALFEEIEATYNTLKERLLEAETQPSVLIGTYFGEFFNAPAGKSYMTQLFEDANIHYTYQNTEGTGSLELNLEEVVIQNRKVDFWVNMAAASKKELLQQNDKFKLLDCVQNGQLYSYMENMNCYWENSPLAPHLILEDLGKIFHPELFEDTEFHFYSKLK